MALTIRDVALAAGVSTATVSRALRGLDNVEPSTREHVQAVARSLNFSISPTASRLATGRTGSIGIVTPFIARWYFTGVFAGIEQALHPHDVDMLLHVAGPPDDAETPVHAHERMRRRVDGALVLNLPARSPEVQALLGIERPIVLLGSQVEGMASASIDDRAAARMAVSHLVDLGHTRIALIGGAPKSTMFIPENERLAGYLEVLAENGLDADPALRAPGYFTVRGGEDAMATLLTQRPVPTAVFCMSDEMAFGAFRALRRRSLVPGRDIAVIGFDGHELAETFDLSTVAQPVRELGRTAAQLLMRSIVDKAPPTAQVLPTVLQVRGSTV